MTLRKLRRRFRSWARRQAYSFFSSLGTLLGHKLGTLMTALVLGIAMVLPLAFYVTVKNLGGLDLQEERWGSLSVFLTAEAGPEDADALARDLAERFGAEVETVSPESGMAQFREASGFGQAIELFDENPLPWVLLVSPSEDREQELQQVVMELAAWIDGRPDVDQVQFDYKWLQRLSGLLALGRAATSVLTALLALAVVVVVANTIRLDVANRADEIRILNMVGAGNGFVRQPFLYSGLWYGLIGALLALFLLNTSLLYLQQPLDRLLDAYGNAVEVRGLGLAGSLLVLAGGGMLGLLGAWVSVERYLRQFRVAEPPLKGRIREI